MICQRGPIELPDDLGGWACTPLPRAENNARAEAQQVLLVACGIGQLSAQLIALDGADGDVPAHLQVKSPSGQYCQ
jgi:hypothetical protein